MSATEKLIREITKKECVSPDELAEELGEMLKTLFESTDFKIASAMEKLKAELAPKPAPVVVFDLIGGNT